MRLALVAFSLAFACAKPRPASVAPIATLPAGVYPLGAPDALRNIVEGAEVVALGESVHTSGGFERVKAQVVRDLVEHQGFRVIAIESPRTDADLMARYVATCAGDPLEALRGLFGVWQDESVLELAGWMCRYNQHHPDDPVAFFGFDVQQPSADAAYLRSLGLSLGLESCDGTPFASGDAYETWYAGERAAGRRPSVSHDLYAACIRAVRGIRSAIAGSDTLGVEQREWAKLSLLGIEEWQRYRHLAGPARQLTDSVVERTVVEGRDRAMFEVLETMRRFRYPGRKVVIWSHNDHIARDRLSTQDHPFRNLGSYLAEALGDRYVPIGLVGHEVEIDWFAGRGDRQRIYERMAPVTPTVESLLYELGRAELLVDLDAPFIPARVVRVGETRMIPREQFRALIYVEHSRPLKRPGSLERAGRG